MKSMPQSFEGRHNHLTVRGLLAVYDVPKGIIRHTFSTKVLLQQLYLSLIAVKGKHLRLQMVAISKGHILRILRDGEWQHRGLKV